MKINLRTFFVHVSSFSWLFLFFSGSYASPGDEKLIISEVADPSDVYKARFVELFNPNSGSLNFQTQTWYLCRQSNGSSWQSVQLTGSIPPGETYVVAYNETEFQAAYGYTPDKISGIINGNGDDGYFLFRDGNYLSGTLIDCYGVVDQDGTGQSWEYTDSKATRRFEQLTATASWEDNMWIIRANINTTYYTPGLHRDTITWSGSISNQWTNVSNFNSIGLKNFLPDIGQDVFINYDATYFPLIQDTGFCHHLKLLSDNNSTATILNHERLLIDGEATISLFVSGGIHTKDDPDAIYHYVSPPVDSTPVEDVFPLTAFVRRWEESTQKWESIYAGENLYSGEAYSCWLEGGDTYVDFTGRLVNEAVYPEISYTSSVGNPSFSGYNLVGNPYPCSIDWDEGSWTKTNIDASIAIWSEENGGYIYWNGFAGNITNGVIPPCQGFFIKANDVLPTIGIPMDARVSGNENLYKNNISDCLRLKITSENGYADECFVLFNPYASGGFDNGFDAYKLTGLAAAPNICSRAEDMSLLAINTIPANNQNMDVNLEFFSGSDGDFLLHSSGTNSFIGGIGIMLEDLLTGTYIDLRIDTLYAFTYNTIDDPARFVIHFSGLTTIPESYHPQFEVKVQAKQLNIYSPEHYSVLELYELSGKKVLALTIEKGEHDIQLNYDPGIYVLRLFSGNGALVEKIRIF